MKIAITGGTGFVGGHLAASLIEQGHQVVLISRTNGGIGNAEQLAETFSGCDAVAHCAGINREIGDQTYQRVHIDGTKNVVNAARKAGVKKVALLSFLRARPNCGSGYHNSKWMAEEIVRNSGLDYTILKAGVIYGKGDHMLDHLSHALHTFPFFALVGMKDKLIRPTAVQDVIKILIASLVGRQLSRQTVAVTGPDEMYLSEAVKRVADSVGKRPAYFPLPVAVHYALAWIFEKIMKVPLISLAQTRILSEGITEALPHAERLPEELRPKIGFESKQIKIGLPTPKAFGLSDLKPCCR